MATRVGPRKIIDRMAAISLGLMLGLGLTAWGATFNLFAPATGILVGNASSYVTTAATSSNVRTLWSGTCDATTFLRGDGACAAAGAGSVSSVDAAGTGIFSFTGGPITTTGTLTLTQAGTSGGVPYFSNGTTLASSAALGANRLVLGGGAGTAPATLGSLGTTTTVLHGNAAGAPTFGAVDLAADVTGDLPFANLTQGSALSVLGVAGNSTADFASIAAASDGQTLRRSGTTLAFGALDLANANAITGDIPDANLSANVPLLNLANTFATNQTVTASGVSTSALVIENTGTGQAQWTLNRTSGTVSNWAGYLPSGSTDFRLYDGTSDQLVVKPSGAGISYNAVDFTPSQGTFVATFDAACTTDVTITFDYSRVGNIVVLIARTNTGTCTSDSTSFSTTAAPVPAAIRPTGTGAVTGLISGATNNGTAVASCFEITTAGNMNIYNYPTGFGNVCASSSWTNSGSKAASFAGLTIPYMLGNP